MKIYNENEYYTPEKIKYKLKYSKDDMDNIFKGPDYVRFDIVTTDKGEEYYFCGDYISNLINEFEYCLSEFNKEFDYTEYLISEISATLSIEGINSSRKNVSDVIEKKNIKNERDKNIFNLLEAYEFIKNNEINEENLSKVYNLIIKNIDMQGNEIESGFYRNDGVDIGRVDKGISHLIVENKMKELIDAANNLLTIGETFGVQFKRCFEYALHYQFVFIHPYFDGNGRTARVFADWLSTSMMKENKMLPISMIIQFDKPNYYKAIRNVRNSSGGRDITYIIEYLFKAAVKYMRTFIYVQELKKEISMNFERLTKVEENYIYTICYSNLLEIPFTWEDLNNILKVTGDDLSKQGILKTLNSMVDKNILDSHEKKTKFFILKKKNFEF